MTTLEIKQLAEKYLNEDFSAVNIVEAEGVLAAFENGVYTAGGKTVPQKLRALSLIAFHKNEACFHIEESPRFTHLGAMIDVSRAGVMRVEKVKEFIDRIALFGANELMLYTEDIYQLEDYPHFGYLRGAYTDEELREMDDYGYALGVELVPCIQTLGHFDQYLTWGAETADFRDTNSVLLCDCAETDRFIEAEIKKMRSVFRSRRIHIGMDEALDVGLGQYLRLNGFTDRFELLKRHLKKVCNLCEKYDFAPIMWSDMFFRTGSKTNDYYDLETQMPDNISQGIPDCEMAYWDYYHDDRATYREMFRLHRNLKRPISFFGGLATWYGFVPNYQWADTMSAAGMKACIEEGVQHVSATLWGDDGCECDYFRSLCSFAYFSEACYHQDPDDRAHIENFGRFMTGITKQEIEAANLFHQFGHILGKRLIWADPFYKLLGYPLEEGNLPEQMMAAGNALLQSDEYTARLLRIAAMKGTLHLKMQNDYKNGKDLTVYRDELLPNLMTEYKRLSELHIENFLALNKPFGVEKIQIRYAGTLARLQYAIGVLDDYINGKTKTIEVMDYEPLDDQHRGPFYRRIATTML